jgi:hypothetical protein
MIGASIGQIGTAMGQQSLRGPSDDATGEPSEKG